MPNAKNFGPFRLLALSVELQLRIFEFAVTKDSPVCINMDDFAHTPADDPHSTAVRYKWIPAREEGQHLPPPICQANQITKADAIKMLRWGETNTFE